MAHLVKTSSGHLYKKTSGGHLSNGCPAEVGRIDCCDTLVVTISGATGNFAGANGVYTATGSGFSDACIEDVNGGGWTDTILHSPLEVGDYSILVDANEIGFWRVTLSYVYSAGPDLSADEGYVQDNWLVPCPDDPGETNAPRSCPNEVNPYTGLDFPATSGTVTVECEEEMP